jgi:6-phosphogluconolactonase (cycloisomerase 2 family)
MQFFSVRLTVLCAVVLGLFSCLPALSATAPQQPRFAYVANNQDGTVSVFEVDKTMLRARDYAYVAGSSPLSLALTPSQRFLYVGGNGSPGLVGYSVNADTGELTPLAPTSFSNSLFQLKVDPSGKFLVSATGSSVDSYRINAETGALLSTGSGSASSPIALAIHPSGKLVYAIDVNNDEVSAFYLNPTTGVLTSVAGSPFPTNSTNPFAAAIDPAGRYLFIPNVNGGNLTVFAINSSTGALMEVEGSPFATGGGPWAVAVSPSGNILYVSNSYDKTISAFVINSTTGSLSAVTGSPFSSGATAALGLTIDPSGEKLYGMDHDSNEVVIFSINPSTGALKLENTVRSRGAAYSMAIVSGKDPAPYVPKSVYVTNAISNNISAFNIASSSGSLTVISGSPFPTGSFPSAISSDAGGRFVFTGNVGDSTVSAFTVDAATGTLSPAPGSPFSAGKQPTSVAVDNGAHFVYACNNLDNTISGYSVSAFGALTSVAGFPMSTLPYLDPLALTIDPRGKVLYVVNATSNNVVSYSIDPGTGSLTELGEVATGSFPDSVAVDPTGRFLLVNNSLSANVYVYAIDGPTGAATQVAASSSRGLANPYAIAADPSGNRAYVGNGNPSDIVGYRLNTGTGVLKQLPSSPYSGVATPFSLSFDLSGSYLYVANNSGNNVSGYAVNNTTGALTAVPGGPFAAGSAPTAVTVVDSVRP